MTLERQLLAAHQLAILPTVVFDGDIPEPLQETLVEHLGDLVDEPIGAPGLSSRMGERLSENAWVEKVESVLVRNDGFGLMHTAAALAVVQDGGTSCRWLTMARGTTSTPGILSGAKGPMPVGERSISPTWKRIATGRMLADQPFMDQSSYLRPQLMVA
jgi:hypothetical protein